MANTFRFTDEELHTLRYAVSQRIYRIEALLEERKALFPEDSIVIGRLTESLCSHEGIYEKLCSSSEGGEADEK